MTNLKIIQVNINDLKPAAYNPRRFDDKATRDLTESIKRFGLVDPILCNGAENRKNIVIGGHFRLKIAKELGFTEVPVVYIDIPNVEKEKELNLRLNRNTGDWDTDLLKEFDVELLLDVGFDDNDLSGIWDENISVSDDNFDVKKAVESVASRVKIGELWQLGKHQLLCGDAVDPTVIAKLLGNAKVDLFNFDPPYNINLNYDKGIGGKQNYGGQTKDNKSRVEYKQFLISIFSNALEHRRENVNFFSWCDQMYVGLLQEIFSELDIKYQRTCLWIKGAANPTPNVAFNKLYEPCLHGVIGKPYLNNSFKSFAEVLNPEIEGGNRCLDDILDLIDLWLVKRISGSDYQHPTQKPPSLYERALKRCSKPGDVVMEAFGGSGSLLIACEQLKRQCFMTEIEPVFCDVIISRWEELTGMTAVRVEEKESNAN